MNRWTASLVGALLLSLTSCQDQSQSPNDGTTIEYVAIGDSHAAAPHTPDTDLSKPCLRSDQNYPHLLAELKPELLLTDVSCSGADSSEVLDDGEAGGTDLPAQLDALSDDTDLVTVNIGGNDSNFFLSWATQCAQLAPSDPQGSPCADENQLAGGDRLLDLVPEIKENVSLVLAEVEDRAPEADVIVVTYPKLFPDEGTCPLASAYAIGDHAYINLLMETLSDAIVAAAKEAGVKWVDVFDASRGHDICAKEPWVNGITDDQSRANWLHPFPEEQAAVARLILKKLSTADHAPP